MLGGVPAHILPSRSRLNASLGRKLDRDRTANKKVPLLPKRENGGTILPHNPLISFTLRGALVPGGGIEPPTRGFSIHCSTPELPGHGDGWSVGCGGDSRGSGGCPEANPAGSMGLRRRIFCLLQCLLHVVRILRRGAVGAAQPLGQIDVRAALRTERPPVGKGGTGADRTGHDSSLRTTARLARSRFLCNSQWPSGVQPATLVSTGSARRAAFSAVSTSRRCALVIGAKSTTTCPPSPRSLSARGRALAAARLALRPAAGDVSPRVFTSTAT